MMEKIVIGRIPGPTLRRTARKQLLDTDCDEGWFGETRARQFHLDQLGRQTGNTRHAHRHHRAGAGEKGAETKRRALPKSDGAVSAGYSDIHARRADYFEVNPAWYRQWGLNREEATEVICKIQPSNRQAA